MAARCGVVPSAARNLRPHTLLHAPGLSPRTQCFVGGAGMDSCLRRSGQMEARRPPPRSHSCVGRNPGRGGVRRPPHRLTPARWRYHSGLRFLDYAALRSERHHRRRPCSPRRRLPPQHRSRSRPSAPRSPSSGAPARSPCRPLAPSLKGAAARRPRLLHSAAIASIMYSSLVVLAGWNHPFPSRTRK